MALWNVFQKAGQLSTVSAQAECQYKVKIQQQVMTQHHGWMLRYDILEQNPNKWRQTSITMGLEVYKKLKNSCVYKMHIIFDRVLVIYFVYMQNKGLIGQIITIPNLNKRLMVIQKKEVMMIENQ
ncbi:unnamed protein product (macronuclear) [Paramecium tetraurelia]|uniref:Uncharacterized protein n=1 Tax=Paramecium tetraurelia TaxID=5888 RepID=A0EGG2_PARTE|nr:uncharacterized protein GSPATT00026727001 [Paramecium tetraurelia]CAK94403.1 unnamed protein product [Paramecium tetraurelia]|eukprot:XP_001461776.1 hypothetical protein (macronuclear) [Paramecium tetraurelia strain d4-2]